MVRIAHILMIMALFGQAVPVYASEALPRNTIAIVRVGNDSGMDVGGCMARLDVPFTVAGCANRWVSFDCDGVFTAKDIAYRKLDTAQLAFALGRKVDIVVDETQVTGSGYCVVERIDLTRF